MNKRIEQLALQAGMKTTSMHYGRRDPYVLWEDDIEKFAWLVIQECISRVSASHPLEDRTESGCNAAAEETIKRNIEQHFRGNQ